MVSLPTSHFDAVILDLDGVITRTAELHGRAWKQTFDKFLEDRTPTEGEVHRPFDIQTDYFEFVDGKPRYDGIRSFLSSRSIELDEGTPDDAARDDTIFGLGRRKNDAFHQLLRSEGVETYEDALEQIGLWREAGLQLALVSSSRNGRRILDAAGLLDAFDAIVDGSDLEKLNLNGKPAPDMFEEAALRLKTVPERCAVIEDAAAGVAAGRAGNFALVVGVERNHHRDELLRSGADLVVSDLREVRLRDRRQEDQDDV